MRHRWGLLAALLLGGCNALTGADDLELVPEDCPSCPDASADANRADAGGKDGAASDAGAGDAANRDASLGDSSAVSDGARPDGASDGAATDTAAPEAATDVGVYDALAPCSTDLACNDGKACTTDRCVSGKCRNEPADGDGDGESSSVGGCGLDCHDGEKNVFSTQKNFFAGPYTTLAGASSFDYNCDGVEEKRYGATATCTYNTTVARCIGGGGWSGVVPKCGVTTTYYLSCSGSSPATCALSSPTSRTQQCR